MTAFRSRRGGQLPASTAAGPLTARPPAGAQRRPTASPSPPSGRSRPGPETALTQATLVVGVPLADVQDTAEPAGADRARSSGVGVLAAVAVLGAVARAARAAAADATSRTRPTPSPPATSRSGSRTATPTTEVGRLGRALNAMLGTIEVAFAERTARPRRRLRQFVADASHELQTPLTSVRGYAELFRRGAADRPEDLANAMRASRRRPTRMGVLVDDLLLLARLDQGRPMEREPVDLAAVARDLVADARAVDPDRPIDLRDGGRGPSSSGRRAAPAPGRRQPAEQRADPHARRSRRSPSGRRDGAEAVLEVADHGPGMPPEHAGGCSSASSAPTRRAPGPAAAAAWACRSSRRSS